MLCAYYIGYDLFIKLFLTLCASDCTCNRQCWAPQFFFKSANPQPNFNFLNPQVRNWTFKSLVRNDVLGFLNPQVRNFVILEVRNFVILEVRNFVMFEVRTASPQLFMNRVEEFCHQPRPEVICSELISKNKSKVVTCGKYSKRSVWWIHSSQ